MRAVVCPIIAVALAVSPSALACAKEGDRPVASDSVRSTSGSVAVSAQVTSDWVRAASGGVRTGEVRLHGARGTIDWEPGGVVAGHGRRFRLSVLHVWGESPSALVGDAQAVDNLDSPTFARLYELWTEQSFAAGRFGVGGGIYDLNSEFDAIETAGLFLHSSHGMGRDFSQVGRAGPSIFPVTGLAVRGRRELSGGRYVQAVVADGCPGDANRPGDPTSHDFTLSADQGALVVLQTGRSGVLEDSNGMATRWYAGLWHHTAAFPTLAGDETGSGTPMQRGNTGAYAMLEQVLVPRSVSTRRALGGWIRAGGADPRVSRFAAYVGAGLVWQGAIPGREEDRLGIAIAHARNGALYRASVAAQSVASTAAETALELTYNCALASTLSIQPDFQFVVHPDSDPTIPNASVYGVRLVWAARLGRSM